jgi:light-regulated signal transduction histidine kinase (bacteriophytochrome)
MGSTEICRPGHKLRLLLLEENGVGEDPVVWEMDYDGNNLPGDPRTTPEKLHHWLSEKKICPCEPRRHAEKEVARKMDELLRSNQELEQFAYMASHDLREPLRMVATYTQLLSERYRGKLDKSADQYLAYAADGALRMQALIQDLLNLSRVGQEQLRGRGVDCNSALEDVLRDMDSAIHESNAIVHHEMLPVVRADHSYVTQLFQNLIANAIKFRRTETPVVSVLAEPANASWQFSVTDNGIGIAPESQANIFNVFERLHGRTEYPGNGIGLAICRRIVVHYGGRIWVESKPGHGSSFKFTLPGAQAIEGAS